MNISMPMPSEKSLFPNFVQMSDHMVNGSNEMKALDGSNELCDLFAPIPIGRGSGCASPASFGTKADDAPSTPDGTGTNANCSAEDLSRSFPIILHTIVSEESYHCIHWLPCGTRFVIADKEDFSKDVLPRFFGGRGGATTKFTSFTRRLKRWNFSRVPSGREMGAYYHEKFRRGEPELVKAITYPVSKVPAASKSKGANKSAGSKPVVPKARRRASTGSMPVPMLSKFDEPLLDISPTPVKNAVKIMEGGATPSLPILESDMKNWLTSSDFMVSGGSSSNNIDAGPPSVVSNSSNSSSLLPGPGFPNIVMSGGFQGEASGMMNPMLARPMRRHSMTMPPAQVSSMYAQMSAISGNGSQLLGSTFSCDPDAGMNAGKNCMSYALNNNMAMTMKQIVPTQNTQPQPQPQHIGSSGDDDIKDPFDLSKEFSFGDLKMIDPFT
eukprot:CAMPEP_0183702888 /NCGR_PEP_ID=MMETSP0737-20130205/839_1 /TAXON_ID=385413 /ORGANISM="Thalassiosira miniscula, Strain CCMP1093" /LENGTH=439 /DNA_ID=CAMNT_0025929571 /DNA_START=119 /DNA_END=1438 /DNA_ORIENTATION=-